MNDKLSLVRTPRELLDHPLHGLRLGTQELDPIAPSTAALAEHMLRTMYREEGGVGLAAPMVGVLSKLIVVDIDEQVFVMANPRIVEVTGDAESANEANLCLPHTWAPVTRQLELTIEFDDLSGEHHRLRCDGWLARVIAHELEMLEGGFYLDGIDNESINFRPPSAAATAAMVAIAAPLSIEVFNAMPALSIVTLPTALLDLRTSILQRRAEPVALDGVDDERLRWLVREMFVLQHHLEGIGLAAPQVGLSMRLAVIDSGRDDPIVLLNPELLDTSDETEEGTEGCLSLPWLTGPVTRSSSVKVRTHDFDGTPRVLEAEGFLARVIQHELDHLDGVLYTDHLEDLQQLRRIDPETLADQAMASVLHAHEPDPPATS